MTIFNPDNPFVLAMKGWDAIVPTSECRHCEGTGIAPGDGTTDCGFCIPDNRYNEPRGTR